MKLFYYGCWLLLMVAFGWFLVLRNQYSKKHSQKPDSRMHTDRLESFGKSPQRSWGYGCYLSGSFLIGIIVAGFTIVLLTGMQRLLFKPHNAWYFEVPDLATICLGLLSIIIGVSCSAVFQNVIITRFPSLGRLILRQRRCRLRKGQSRTSLESLAWVLYLILAIPVFFGMFNYFAVTPDGIVKQSFGSLSEHRYGWEGVKEVAVYAKTDGNLGTIHSGYVLTFQDGSELELWNTGLSISRLYTIHRCLLAQGVSFQVTPPDLRTTLLLKRAYQGDDLKQIQQIFQD